MSKSISFPILEIVTLIVVLFACVLVIIPGFDEFATSMLFDLDRRRPVSSVDVAAKTDTDADRQDAAAATENLVADNTSFNPPDATDFPELKVQTELDLRPSNENEDAPEFDYPLDPPETLELPPLDRMVVGGNERPEPKPAATMFDFNTFKDSDQTPSIVRPPASKGFPLNGYLTTEATTNQSTESDLPKIIHQVGNSLQQQPSPKFIRMAQFFKSDTRVVVNSTYLNQDPDISPISAMEGGRSRISPNVEPYQIRTTARPKAAANENTTDFVPQR